MLSAAALALVGPPPNPAVLVRCHAPTDHPSWGRVVGWTYYDYPAPGMDTIFLRYCAATVDLRRPAVDTFAHELLHVEHPEWPHPKVYATEHAYGAVVLRELEAMTPREEAGALRHLLADRRPVEP